MSQATGGFVGKILIIDLTSQTAETISSEPYQQWGGGHGMGSALFWDFCEDKTVGPFDEGNVVTVCANPFSGTPVPSASARVEIQGIGSFAEPEWFTRSSMGGRIAGMIKAAGYDAYVVKGASSEKTWVNVVNGEVEFRNADDLWGLDTAQTQEFIWDYVTGGTPDGEWYTVGTTRDGGRTTQKPAVMCIGPTGENLGRTATITHDAGHHAGQSGLGAVWGAKNLKAVSFLGTGSVPVADPAALIDLRIEFQQKFSYNIDDPVLETPNPDAAVYGFITRHPGFNGIYWNARDMISRPYGCQGCFRNCRHNFDDGIGNGIMCAASLFYMSADNLKDQVRAADLQNKLGMNGFETSIISYCRNLYKMGVMGPGKEIESNLPFDKFGSWEFAEAFIKAIAYREDIGADLAEGSMRAVKKWGRWEEDSANGTFMYPQWGYFYHYDPRLEVEWSYASIMSERDVNEHGLNWHVHWMPMICSMVGEEPLISAEEMVNRLAASTTLDDPMCFDYSEEGIYSDATIEKVAWMRHYGRFWVQSMGMCDWLWPHLIEYASPTGDPTPATPDFEPRMYKAVTGVDITFEESLEMGKKIYALDRAIWHMQGRHRDQEKFAEFVYSLPTSAPYPLPVFEDGKWEYGTCMDRTLDRERFETVKDRFYEHEGWDVSTGCPTRATLESYGLGNVADALEAAGALQKG